MNCFFFVLLIIFNLFLIQKSKANDRHTPTQEEQDELKHHIHIGRDTTENDFKTIFYIGNKIRHRLMLNELRSTILYRLGTLLYDYDYFSLQSTATIQQDITKQYENLHHQFSDFIKKSGVNATNKYFNESDYFSIMYQCNNLVKQNLEMINQVRSYMKPNEQSNRRETRSALDDYATANRRISQGLEQERNIIHQTSRVDSLMINAKKNMQSGINILKTLNELGNQINLMINESMKVQHEMQKQLEDLNELNNLSNDNQNMLELLQIITTLNSFTLNMQEILKDIDAITAGELTMRPFLKLLAESNDPGTSELNKVLEYNRNIEDIDSDYISKANKIRRYLVVQTVEIIEDATFGINITFNHIFIDLRRFIKPFFGIYSVHQYLLESKNNTDSKVFSYKQIPEIIAVDGNLTYFIPMTLRDYRLCKKDFFTICKKTYFKLHDLEKYPCVKQIFYHNLTLSLKNCTIVNVPLYQKTVRLSYNRVYEITKGKIIDYQSGDEPIESDDTFTEETKDGLESKMCKHKYDFNKEFSAAPSGGTKSCVKKTIKFDAIDLEDEIKMNFLSFTFKENAPDSRDLINKVKNNIKIISNDLLEVITKTNEISKENRENNEWLEKKIKEGEELIKKVNNLELFTATEEARTLKNILIALGGIASFLFITAIGYFIYINKATKNENEKEKHNLQESKFLNKHENIPGKDDFEKQEQLN